MGTQKEDLSAKNSIYFLHGNGFPSRSYQKMLNALKPEYDVLFMDKIGHNTDYPITQNWTYLVDECIADIEKKSDVPVIAVGHSMGGIIALMASVKRPDLFKTVITLDSYIVGKMKLKIIQLSKYFGGIERLTPAGKTKNRRNHWESKEAVKEYFKSKPFFRYFDSDCFDDYMEYGTKKDNNGYYLEFDREREYQIYCTIPHTFSLFSRKRMFKNAHLKGQNTSAGNIPWALIYGNDSHLMRDWRGGNISAVKKQYQMHCFSMKGSHMFPLEYPIECAEKIREVIHALL